MRRSRTPSHASRNPIISSPWIRSPMRTAALITALRPGQSPPPVRIPTRTRRIVRCRTRRSPGTSPEPSPGSGPTGRASGTFAVRDRYLRDRPRRGHHRRALAGRSSPTGATSIASYREFTQYFPEPGWVEHDAGRDLAGDGCARCGTVVAGVDAPSESTTSPRSASPTSARRCSPGTARPASRTARRSSGRTAGRRERCDELDGGRRTCRSCANAPASCSTRTSPARRSSGCCTDRDIPIDDDLAIGTIDAWLIWNLTGGARVRHRRHQRQSHDAVRHPQRGSGIRELCDLLHVPIACLPEIVPSSGRIGVTADSRRGARPASRSAGWRATSRRRCSVRRASNRGWRRTPTARVRSSCSTSARRVRHRPTGC